MKKASSFFINCFFILCCNSCVAQTPSYKHYDVNNGLPTNEVYEIKQDSKGFLWIGCDAGLVRYDGNKFKLLTNKKNRGPAITGLREDSRGRIWCTNFSGQVFYATGDTLQLFEPWEKNYKNNFAEITIDKNDNLFISNFSNNIYRYNLGNGTEKIVVNNRHLKQAPFTGFDGTVIFTSLQAAQVLRITDTGTAIVPVVNEKGIRVSIPALNNLVFYNSFNKKQTLGFQRFNRANKDPVLFSYLNQTLVIHPVTSLLQKLNAFPTSCFDDDRGNLFIGTLNGLYWFKKTINGQWVLFNTSLQGNGISYVQQDKESGIWIATLKNGVYKISNKDIWTIPQNQVKTRTTAINHLTTDGRSFIFGAATSGEIFGFDTKNGQTTLINTPENRDAQALEFNAYSNGLFISKTGTYIFSPNRKTVANISLVSSNAKDFYFTKDGIIFHTGTGISAAFASDNKFAKEKLLNEFDTLYLPLFIYKMPGYEILTLFSQRSKGIHYEEKQKRLWVGFVDGLVYYENKKLNKFTDPVTQQPIVAIDITAAKDNTLYVASVEQGIYVIQDKKIIGRFTVADGLLSDRIKRIKLSNNSLWIVCGGAVQSFNLQTHSIKTINTTSGLLSPEIFDVEVLHDTIYVATANGIQFFPENIVTKNNTRPSGSIFQITADEKIVSAADNILLPHNINNISFQLQGIALKSDGKFTYQYRLLPSEKNWITVSANENIIRFSSLSPGNYTFESRVVNEDGIMSEKIAGQKFTVERPWWQQWWFVTLALLLSALILYLLFKNRMKANRQKLEEELAKSKIQEELRQSQLSSLKAQMNPHFMFNALNSIQEFILTNDKRQANMYMGKFADLMRMTLDMSNKKEITLEDEIKVLELYLQLEALRFEEKFNYNIEVAENVHTADIYLPSMLIQPYVENAVKHGLLHIQHEKILTIVFNVDTQNILICTITDNGIGRKRSNELNEMRQKKYTSFATGATQKRLELLNHERETAIAVVYDDLHDANGNASGTKVTLKIPV